MNAYARSVKLCTFAQKLFCQSAKQLHVTANLTASKTDCAPHDVCHNKQTLQYKHTTSMLKVSHAMKLLCNHPCLQLGEHAV